MVTVLDFLYGMGTVRKVQDWDKNNLESIFESQILRFIHSFITAAVKSIVFALFYNLETDSCYLLPIPTNWHENLNLGTIQNLILVIILLIFKQWLTLSLYFNFNFTIICLAST